MDLPNIDPKILPYLIAGGGSALAGGALTAAAKPREGESRGSRRWRILRNALMLGGAGAGAYGLVNKGIKDTVTQPLPANDQNPLTSKFHDIVSSPLAYGASAAGGVGMGIKRVMKEEARGAKDLWGKAMNAANVDKTKAYFPENTKDALRNTYREYLGGATDKTPAQPGKKGGPGKPASPTMHGAVGGVEMPDGSKVQVGSEEALRNAGINKSRELFKAQTQTKGNPSNVGFIDKFRAAGKPWRSNAVGAAKNEGKLFLERLLGNQARGGKLVRTGIAGTAVALPYLLSKITEQQDG